MWSRSRTRLPRSRAERAWRCPTPRSSRPAWMRPRRPSREHWPGCPRGSRLPARFVTVSPRRSCSRSTHSVDLLVLGTRGRGPARRLMLGSVCDAVVCAAACPVLVVAPAVEAKDLPRQEDRSPRRCLSRPRGHAVDLLSKCARSPSGTWRSHPSRSYGPRGRRVQAGDVARMLRADELQLGRGEAIADTAHSLISVVLPQSIRGDHPIGGALRGEILVRLSDWR